MACAITSEIRTALIEKEIIGNVWRYPIEGNDIHGIVTGGQTKKKNMLRDTFKMNNLENASSFEQKLANLLQLQARQSS